MLLSLLPIAGCSTALQNVGLAVGLGGAYAARSPSTELQQIYYLGVFDPQDQLPPTVYRVRVQGQASALSSTHFSSGWVPSDVIDSLGSSISFDKESGRIQIEKAADQFKTFQSGRRLMLFGPEGFREAPANHRLVIVMGSSPEKFFAAIDESLGVIAEATQGKGGGELERFLFEAMVHVRNERAQLDAVISTASAGSKP